MAAPPIHSRRPPSARPAVATAVIVLVAGAGCLSSEPRDNMIALAAPPDDATPIAIAQAHLEEAVLRPLQRLLEGEETVRLTGTKLRAMLDRLEDLHLEQHGRRASGWLVVSYEGEVRRIVTMSVE